MIPSAHFREQQARARAISRRIVEGVDRYRTPDDSFAIVLDIARLTGMLAIHFAQIDRSLVPRLVQGDDDVRRLALRFRDEFGEFGRLVKLFNTRWGTSAAISGDPVAFRVDVHQLIDAVEERFVREDRDLFRVNDRLASLADIEFSMPPAKPPVAIPNAA
ncbi:hemerythrin domain-containing protein [Sphingomicrobium clamense]|uniref:Hemerythrin-like domain-containing protein n=1 Tax=Sphingomicrobium clamense TaxID=2851013 RepID=A0ABS6V418_9SPHN|nr:hemerythrin domain-containing protein [Sphingomicrobium sp. B8]MBW0144302.1 hypothetical protein [Sphingomicrobium sp. B8]